VKAEETSKVIPYIPTVYRFLNRCYVDEFFSSGKLMLSSILKFRSHPDELRRDANEGVGRISTQINGEPVLTDLQVGLESFVLCSSLMHSPQLYQEFKCDSCIVIEEPLRVAYLIAQALNSVDRVLFGPCSYLQNRTIEKVNGSKNQNCRSDADYEALFMDVVPTGAVDVLFRKELRFQHQHEFRFVWDVSSDSFKQETRIIEIPEAASLCSRLDKNS